MRSIRPQKEVNNQEIRYYKRSTVTYVGRELIIGLHRRIIIALILNMKD